MNPTHPPPPRNQFPRSAHASTRPPPPPTRPPPFPIPPTLLRPTPPPFHPSRPLTFFEPLQTPDGIKTLKEPKEEVDIPIPNRFQPIRAQTPRPGLFTRNRRNFVPQSLLQAMEGGPVHLPCLAWDRPGVAEPLHCLHTSPASTRPQLRRSIRPLLNLKSGQGSKRPHPYYLSI